jgi:hypothetical protein
MLSAKQQNIFLSFLQPLILTLQEVVKHLIKMIADRVFI